MTEAAAAAASLDHVGLVGRDLPGWIERYRRLGFAPTRPNALMGRDPVTGASTPLGQSSAHLVFETGYVELTAVESDSPGHHLAACMRRHEGLHILAFGVDDLRAAHDRCVAAGVRAGPLAIASRSIEYGTRHGEARFEWFMLEPEASPEGLVCFVRQRNPELVFQPEVQRHPNAALALAGVYVLAQEAGAVAQRFAAITGARCGTGGELSLPGGWVRVLEPGEFAGRFPAARVPPAPCLGGFAVRTRDPAQVAQRLARGGIAAAGHRDGGVWFGVRDAGGCVLEFVA